MRICTELTLKKFHVLSSLLGTADWKFYAWEMAFFNYRLVKYMHGNSKEYEHDLKEGISCQNQENFLFL